MEGLGGGEEGGRKNHVFMLRVIIFFTNFIFCGGGDVFILRERVEKVHRRLIIFAIIKTYVRVFFGGGGKKRKSIKTTQKRVID